MSAFDPGAERLRAGRRILMAGLLLAGLGGYRVRQAVVGPLFARAAARAPARLKPALGALGQAPAEAAAPPSAALYNAADPVGSRGAGGLDAQAAAALKKEAEAGVAGPAVQGFLEAARKRGDLDRPGPDGRSYAQLLARAQEISDLANAKAAESRRASRPDYDPSQDEPSKVVPEAVAQLSSGDAEERLNGAMTLCDNRYAKWEGAEAAVPLLERLAKEGGKEGDAAGFAELALKRIRFWQKKRELGAQSYR